jgi:hypothetical protein
VYCRPADKKPVMADLSRGKKENAIYTHPVSYHLQRQGLEGKPMCRKLRCALSVKAGAAMLAIIAWSQATTMTANAMDQAKNVYLLGSRASLLSGVLPGPGNYFQNDLYFYNGEAGGGIQLPLGGFLASDVEAKIVALELPTFMHVFDTPVLGGSFAVAYSQPFAYQKITAAGGVTLPNDQVFSASRTEDAFQFGDPFLQGILGWHNGNLHWQVAGALNVPIGEWERDQLVNLGFNRWAGDLTAAATWLDMVNLYQISGAIGVTFNGENLDTGYQSGTELHLEASAAKLFPNGMSLGVAAYHYQQLTDDSNQTPVQEAVLGGFKGRTTGIGPILGLTIPLADRQASANLRWFHEFDVENRLEGDAVFFTVAVPLQPQQAAATTK